MIRHARPDKATRRLKFVGRAITTDDPQERRGLEIEGESVLAFLLARLQALVGAGAPTPTVAPARISQTDSLLRSRHIASTRRRTVGAVLDEGGVFEEQPTSGETDWYMRHIDRLLAPGNDLGAHSKINASGGNVPYASGAKARRCSSSASSSRQADRCARSHRAGNANAPS